MTPNHTTTFILDNVRWFHRRTKKHGRWVQYLWAKHSHMPVTIHRKKRISKAELISILDSRKQPENTQHGENVNSN